MEPIKLKLGRPTSYSQYLADEICETIACSDKGLKRLCAENSSWPDKKTIMRWVIKHPDFGAQYARAKQHQIEAIVDEILDIADDTTQDTVIGADGRVMNDHENINRSRLRIDTRKWLASKLAPKLYGDKAEGQETARQEGMRQSLEEVRSIQEAYQQEA